MKAAAAPGSTGRRCTSFLIPASPSSARAGSKKKSVLESKADPRPAPGDMRGILLLPLALMVQGRLSVAVCGSTTDSSFSLCFFTHVRCARGCAWRASCFHQQVEPRNRVELRGFIGELSQLKGRLNSFDGASPRRGAADLVRDRDLVSRELGQPTELEKIQKRG